MANAHHLKVLSQDSKVWHQWRVDHPSVHPDLTGTDLRKRVLRGFDLSRSNLSGSDLRDTNLRRADLSAARLDGAKMYRALLSRTNLDGTTFRNTVLYETVFADVDLSTAKFLTDCVHKGPSVLDHRTLARSRALPLDFLRGCGLPDDLIEETTRPQRPFRGYWSCFISYSSRDQAFAERLHADLQAHGVRCWFAPKGMPIGAEIRDSIDDAIRETGKVLLVLSRNSMTSNWVKKEFETAFEEEQCRSDAVLFPIRLDESPMESTRGWIADIRRSRNIGDFSRWTEDGPYNDALKRLLRDLQQHNEPDA